ncbi:MAG: VOC family protein [Cyclobacteriaceae bacterium]
MKLYRVIIPVSDISKAAKFYSSIFGVPGKRVSPGRHYFNMGGVIFACFDPKSDGDDRTLGPNPDHVYISIDDLEAFYEKVKSNGAGYISEIMDQPWGEKIFYFDDPFGNKLGIVKKGTEFTG